MRNIITLARQEQVERLLADIDEWNQWRRQQATLLGDDLSEDGVWQGKVPGTAILACIA